MATWECGECGTVYTVGAARCPACGADLPSEEGATGMAKISRTDGPSYAGVIPDELPTTKEYEDAQERVAQGKPESGDGALISRYDSARQRSLPDQHAEPLEVGQRSSADAQLKASDPDAQAETVDPETGRPGLTDAGADQLGQDRGDGDQPSRTDDRKDDGPDETGTPGVGSPPKGRPSPTARGRASA
jgi:hypothetical protein